MANSTEYDIIIKFLIDQAAEGNAVKSIDMIETAFKDAQNQIKETKREIQELRQTTERFGQVARSVLFAGTAIAGGIFAAANNYVKDAKVATEVTLEWKAAQESLSRSGNRVGAVLAEQTLPLLIKAAELATKAAAFVEDHPEIVRAALNTGLVLAGLGAVGVAVSKGIRLFADVAYLAAVAQEQIGIARFDAAVTKFLLGTSEFAGAQGIGGAFGKVSLMSVINGVVALTARGSNQNILNRGRGLYDTLFGKKAETDTGTTAADTGGVQNSAAFEQVLKAYEDYKRDDLALVQKHYTDRERIISDSLAAEQKENAKYAAQVAQVNQNRFSSLSRAAREYAAANTEAEAKYNQDRSEIVKDGGEEIRRIQQQSQDRLRKLALEHANRVEDLTAARDALGLAKENRRYRQELGEERGQTQRETSERRRAIKQRLDDLAVSYEQERAQRAAEYAARKAEINAEARERLNELQTQHTNELKEIREQRVAKIRELDQQFADERKRRYQYFIQQVRDLDASLLGERNLRLKYQAAMIKDLDAFLLAYKSKLGTLSASAGRKAEGGYATYGMYLLGDAKSGGSGKTEYVLNGDTTEALERMIGGQITPERLLSRISNTSGGDSKSVTYNDNRRIDSRISNADRERLRNDAMQALVGVFS